MDSLTDNGKGEFNHERDMSIGYPRMAEFCIAIGVPKSGLSSLSPSFPSFFITFDANKPKSLPITK
jgi:hypothetical protein